MSRPEELSITVRAKLTLDPDRARNFLHMKFADTEAAILIQERRIGEVSGCIGGAIEIGMRNAEGKAICYTIGPVDLFEAVETAYRAAYAETSPT